MDQKRIGFVMFAGMTALDIVGPMEAFAIAREYSAGVTYDLVTLAQTLNDLVTESGLVVRASQLLTDGSFDTVLVPGGSGLREPTTLGVIGDWLAQNEDATRRIGTVCTGLYGAAAGGLLDGRQVTTHWQFADEFAKRFPSVTMMPDRIVTRDGKFYTSGGITAGIDLALVLIEEDCGRSVASRVANQLLMPLGRSGGQAHFSRPEPNDEAAVRSGML